MEAAPVAAATVLTTPALLHEISEYQSGVPFALRDLWLAHADPDKRNSMALHIEKLPTLAAQYGDVALLALTRRVRIRRKFFNGTSGWATLLYTNVADAAISRNSPEILQWAMDNGHVDPFSNHRLLRSLIFKYSEPPDDEDFGLLDVLHEYFVEHVPARFLFVENLSDRLLNLRWLDRLRTGLPHLVLEGTGITEAAAVAGKLEVIKYMHQHFPQEKWRLGWLAVEQPPPGYRQCLQYLTTHRNEFILNPTVEIPSFLCRSGEEVLRIVHDLNLFPTEVLAQVERAVGIDCDRKLVEFYHHCGLLDGLQSPVSIDHCPHLSVIEFLVDKGVAVTATHAMDLAAERRLWNIVEFLHTNRIGGCTTRTMDAAARQARLDKVKFLHENRAEGCSSRAMDVAAEIGDLPMIRYLHEHVGAACTEAAIGSAAMRGYVDIVKYLHEQRTEGCSSHALDETAACGHLHLLQFIYAHRRERCTKAAVQKTLLGGYHAVVRFLFQQHPEYFGADDLHGLLLCGVFDLWSTLRDQFPDEADASIASAMVQAGERYELSTIHYICSALGRDDLGYLALEGAARVKNYKWLVAVWKMAGPQSCRLGAVTTLVESIASYQLESLQWLGTLTEDLKFIISACVEPGAKEAAIRVATQRRALTIAHLLTEWTPEPVDEGSTAIHPLLLDPRVPRWMTLRLVAFSPVLPGSLPQTALDRRDIDALKVLLEVSKKVNSAMDPALSFQGILARALPHADLEIVQWLVTNLDEPVDSQLVQQANERKRADVVAWLKETYPGLA